MILTTSKSCITSMAVVMPFSLIDSVCLSALFFGIPGPFVAYELEVEAPSTCKIDDFFDTLWMEEHLEISFFSYRLQKIRGRASVDCYILKKECDDAG